MVGCGCPDVVADRLHSSTAAVTVSVANLVAQSIAVGISHCHGLRLKQAGSLAEIGRQPWTIGEVLPTYLSASTLSTSDLLFSMIGICAFYTVLLVIEMYLMVKFAAQRSEQPENG